MKSHNPFGHYSFFQTSTCVLITRRNQFFFLFPNNYDLTVLFFPTASIVSTRALDLVFLVDGSRDLTSEDFEKLKAMMKKMLDYYTISANATHVGVIEFSDRSNEKIRLTDSYRREDIYARIDAIRPSGGSRRVTDEALTMAAQRMFSINAGGRVGASRALVVLTAGKSTGKQPTSEAVKPLENNGVRVYVVTVGNKVDKDEVQGMVPSDNNVFSTSSDDPGKVVGKIVDILNRDVEESECYDVRFFI